MNLLLLIALIVLALVYIYTRLFRTTKAETYTVPTSVYPYSSNIKSPDEMGASGKGNYTALGNDVDALTGYIDILVSGDSKASRTNGPMGNMYFLKTGGTCTAKGGSADGATVTRYVYINNVPDGDIPIISGALGTKFTEYEGLVPGILEDLGYIDPSVLFQAFSESTDCTEIKMPVRDNNNDTDTLSYYVSDTDISTYNPCWFSDNKNPVTGQTC